MSSVSNYCKGKKQPGREWNHLRVCSDAIHQSGTRKKLPVYPFVYWWVVCRGERRAGQHVGTGRWTKLLAVSAGNNVAHWSLPHSLGSFIVLRLKFTWLLRPFHTSSVCLQFLYETEQFIFWKSKFVSLN